MRCTLLILLAAAGFVAPARVMAEDAAKPADPERIAQLVKQLGDDSFTLREAASDELTRLGLAAHGALEAATRHPDREIRYRSLRIVGLIRQVDQQRRLEAFLAGTDDANDYPLPGWSRFKKAHGDDANSRGLFVEMQRADAELMKAVETGPQAAADALSLRMAQNQQAQQIGGLQVSSGQAAATLFVASQEDVVLPAQAKTMVLNECQHQVYRDLLTNSSRKALARKMLGAIITRTDDWAAYMAMQVAVQYNLAEGLVPALRILENPANRSMRQYALGTLAKLGDASHLPTVEKLLDDKTVVGKMQESVNKDGKSVNVEYEMQVRDAALATAVVLSKQNLTDYFDIPLQQRQLLAEVQIIYYNPRLIGFASEEARTKVFEKWAKHQAERPKPAAAETPAADEAPAPGEAKNDAADPKVDETP